MSTAEVSVEGNLVLHTGELLGWLTLQLLIPSVGRLRSWSSSALPPAIDHLLEVLTSEAGTSVGWMLAAFPLLERLVKDKSLGDTSFSTKAIHLFYLCSLKLNTASPVSCCHGYHYHGY